MRKIEANRTNLFQERARILSTVCVDILASLEPAANAALRNSNLVVRLVPSPYAPLRSWVQVDLCRLDEAGAAGEVVSTLRLSTSSDDYVQYDPDDADLPRLSLASVGNAEIEEILFLYIVASLRKAIAQP